MENTPSLFVSSKNCLALLLFLKYPIATLLHLADMWATYLMETTQDE